jgi:chorismate mutase
MDDAVISALIQRVEFPHNEKIYTKPMNPEGGINMPLLDYFIQEGEKVQALMGRYSCPEEQAFFPEGLPEPVVPREEHKSPLHPHSNINVNDKILAYYRDRTVPRIAKDGDDDQYQLTLARDVAVLELLSKRIHFGKVVAESAFINARERFEPLIQGQDANGILVALTHSETEAKLLHRVREEASQGVAKSGAASWSSFAMIDPEAVVDTFRDCIIPYTKEVQTQYLLRRLTTIRIMRESPGMCTRQHQHSSWGWPHGVGLMGSAKAKEVLSSAGVRVLREDLLVKGEKEMPTAVQVPFLLKPCTLNGGTSQGVTLVERDEDVAAAVEYAFSFDPRAIAEEHIAGRQFLTACIVMQDGTLTVLPKMESFPTGPPNPRQQTTPKHGDRDRPSHAALSPALDKHIDDMVTSAHLALQCGHYSLYRIGVDSDDQPFILEASGCCSSPQEQQHLYPAQNSARHTFRSKGSACPAQGHHDGVSKIQQDKQDSITASTLDTLAPAESSASDSSSDIGSEGIPGGDSQESRAFPGDDEIS